MSKDFQRTGAAAVFTILICLALPGRPGGSSAAPATYAAPPSGAQATTDTLRLAGLRQPVEVRRDRWGVPHIYAASQSDLFFAQGFIAAQDRIFQMEMWRRHGEGRLAEVLGPGYVNRDRLARLFRYRGDMEAEWSSYAPDARAIVSAFVAGVNAFIRDADEPALPPEFGMLGFKPEPWDITVPLSRATGLSGTGNANSEVFRAELVARLGASAVDTLLRTDPPRRLDPAPGLDLEGISSRSLGGFGAAFSDISYNRLEGSNNWVVAAAHTNTGMPILANDPHRVITNPAVRYITHLVAPGWNVIGAGEPASPGVAIGHNDRIAFGLTVVGMDQMDVYVETLGPCPANSSRGAPPRVNDSTETTNQRNRNIAVPTDSLRCYRFRGAWRPVRRIRDTIHVKGEAPRTVDLEFTVHGPIVSVDSARRRAFALRSVHAEPGTASYLASLSLGRARNWKEFEAAMARWHMPSENMIYADRDGNIGWIAAGLMPRRSWSGLLPVPGDGRFEWRGFVPPSQLPRSYNPASGMIATANNNILPAGYAIPISWEWASRFRIDRVNELLAADRKFGVEDFKLMQHDDLSLLAVSLVPHLESAAARMGVANRDEVRQLASWNRRMSRDQLAPSLFAAWAPAAWRRVMLQRTTGMSDVASLVVGRTDYEKLEAILARSRGAHDSALVAALDDGVADLTRRFGPDRKGWGWGTIHTAQFRHSLSSRYDLPAVSRGGDANTVFATGGANFRQTSGASFREIIDLADFDNSVVTNVPGQSADPRSPHYSDLLQLWGNDEYFPLVYSRERVEAETRSILWLFPRGRGQ